MGVSVFIDTPILFPIPFSSCSFFYVNLCVFICLVIIFFCTFASN